VDGWAQIFAAMASMLDSPNPNVVDGALNALSKICEDIGEVRKKQKARDREIER